MDCSGFDILFSKGGKSPQPIFIKDGRKSIPAFLYKGRRIEKEENSRGISRRDIKTFEAIENKQKYC